MTMPSPRPSTSMYADAASAGVATSRRDKRKSAIVISAVPQMGNMR